VTGPAILPARPTLQTAERAILAGVLVFALGFAAAGFLGGGRQAWAIVLRVPPRIIPVLLAMSLLNYFMRGARWLLFARALRLDVPPARNALYYVAGFAMTTTPGKMGEIVRLYLLNRFHGCPYDRSAALLIADRLSDGLATTLVVALTIAAFAHLPAGAAGAALFAALLVTICLRPSLLLAVTDGLFRRLHRWPRLFVRFRRAVRGLQRLAHPRVFAAALVLGAVGWSSEGLSFYVLLHALGVALAPAACVFIFAFAMLVGAASVLPGGLGSTEATMIGLLSLQGVPFETAVVATGVVRVTTLWFAVGLGLVALPAALGGAARVVPAREEERVLS
jgi:uncharacterized protein (TIRG00374 family)